MTEELSLRGHHGVQYIRKMLYAVTQSRGEHRTAALTSETSRPAHNATLGKLAVNE